MKTMLALASTAVLVLSSTAFAAQNGKTVATTRLDQRSVVLQCRKLMADTFPPSVKTPMYQKRNLFIGCKKNGGRFQGS